MLLILIIVFQHILAFLRLVFEGLSWFSRDVLGGIMVGQRNVACCFEGRKL